MIFNFKNLNNIKLFEILFLNTLINHRKSFKNNLKAKSITRRIFTSKLLFLASQWTAPTWRKVQENPGTLLLQNHIHIPLTCTYKTFKLNYLSKLSMLGDIFSN